MTTSSASEIEQLTAKRSDEIANVEADYEFNMKFAASQFDKMQRLHEARLESYTTSRDARIAAINARYGLPA